MFMGHNPYQGVPNPGPNDLNHISDGVWLGSHWVLKSAQPCLQRGIRTVINCAIEFVTENPELIAWDELQRAGIEVHNTMWDDTLSQPIFPSPAMEAAVKKIDEVVRNGGNVLVNCAMGRSRSTSLVCAYLMARKGLTYEQAVTACKRARPVAQPNKNFERQLKQLEASLQYTPSSPLSQNTASSSGFNGTPASPSSYPTSPRFPPSSPTSFNTPTSPAFNPTSPTSNGMGSFSNPAYNSHPDYSSTNINMNNPYSSPRSFIPPPINPPQSPQRTAPTSPPRSPFAHPQSPRGSPPTSPFGSAFGAGHPQSPTGSGPGCFPSTPTSPHARATSPLPSPRSNSMSNMSGLLNNLGLNNMGGMGMGSPMNNMNNMGSMGNMNNMNNSNNYMNNMNTVSSMNTMNNMSPGGNYSNLLSRTNSYGNQFNLYNRYNNFANIGSKFGMWNGDNQGHGPGHDYRYSPLQRRLSL